MKLKHNITRQALQWNPQGKHGRGRPRNTWRRDFIPEMEIECYRWQGARTNIVGLESGYKCVRPGMVKKKRSFFSTMTVVSGLCTTKVQQA
jgi:hypothetical protein